MEEQVTEMEKRIEVLTALRIEQSVKNMSAEERKTTLASLDKDKKLAIGVTIFFGCLSFIIPLIVALVTSQYIFLLIMFLLGGFAVVVFSTVVSSNTAWRKKSDDEKILAYFRSNAEFNYKVKEEVMNEISTINVPAEYDFQYSRLFELTIDKYFLIDETSKTLVIKDGFYYSRVIAFSEIKSYDVYENGNTIISGSAGTALVGGLLFGSTGAIVGSNISRKITDVCNGLSLIIKIEDLELPQLIITFVDKRLAKTSQKYIDLCHKINAACSVLDYIINHQDNAVTEKKEYNFVAQLKSLKVLLDEKLITPEEYNSRKQSILERITN